MKWCDQNNTIDVDVNVTFFYKMVLTPGQEMQVNYKNSDGGSILAFERWQNVSVKRENNIAIGVNPIVNIGGDYWVDNDGNIIGCKLDEYDMANGFSLGEYAKIIAQLEAPSVDKNFNLWFNNPAHKPVSHVRAPRNVEETTKYGLLVAIRSSNSDYARSWAEISKLQFQVKVPLHWRLKVKTLCLQGCDGNYVSQKTKSDYVFSENDFNNADIGNTLGDYPW
jgi:hypothetical protein